MTKKTTKTNKPKIDKRAAEFDIESHTLNADISYRGGSLKIDVSSLFPEVENAVMGAYQNYLGGGIAGSIVGASMFDPSQLSTEDQATFAALKERIKRHFYELNNGGGDEYMQETASYDRTQGLPKSGY